MPGLTGAHQEESVLTTPRSSMVEFVSRSHIARLNRSDGAATPEEAWLGLPPGTVQMARGPLAVAAFGYEPPDRSVHFIVDLLSLNEAGIVAAPSLLASPTEVQRIYEILPRLSTKRFILKEGERGACVLVWENGSLDHLCHPPLQVMGKDIAGFLPDGDGAIQLRALIDDSHNLLMEQEFNRIRIGEGEEPLNLLWPWGGGFRTSVPNLPIRRGKLADFWSESIALQGLCKLANYRHASRVGMRKGMMVTADLYHRLLTQSGAQVVLIPGWDDMRGSDRLDVLSESFDFWTEKFLEPYLTRSLDLTSDLILLAPANDREGLILMQAAGQRDVNRLPFDERIIDEGDGAVKNAWEIIAQALS